MERIKLFMWKVSNNGLMVNTERKRRGLTEDVTCANCGGGEESMDHVLRQCPIAAECWELAAPPTEFRTMNHLPMMLWMKAASSMTRVGGGGLGWNIAFPYILWHIWRARNEVVFNSKRSLPRDILLRAIKEAKEARKCLLSHKGLREAWQVWVTWHPPEMDFVKLNTDGAAKAGSGLASASGLFRNCSGDWIVGYVARIGVTNSFFAELWGLREGLRLARNRGFTNVAAEMDSEAVVQILTREDDTSTTPNRLVADCKLLMNQFQNIKITHIYREGNACADFLANMGQTSQLGTTILVTPPAELIDLLQRDASGFAYSRRR